MPDKKTFGYVYLSVNEITEDYIKSLVMKETGIKDEESFNYVIPNFNYKDYYVFNEIMIDLDKTDSKVVNKTINNIEDKVENVLAITKREDNSSVAFYQGEINEGQDYVGIFSGLFIFIALLSVITTMTRVVKKQRIQIGTLKALGFNDFKILMHYIGYGFWITLAGIIVGILIGHYGLTNVVLNMQMSYFQMPFLESFIDSSTFIVSGVLLVLVSVITFLTGRNILKKNAAETLRNEIPQVNSKTINITRKDIFNKFSFSTKWNIRDILRNKARTFMGIVGITGCSLLIVVSMGMIDSFDNFIDMQFTKLYNFDYKLTLSQNITDNEYDELIKKYDKSSSSLGIEIKNGDERITTSANIIDSGNYLRYINEKDEFIKIDSDKGVYLTRLLAEKNNIKLGDKIKWHILGSNKIYESKVVGLNKDPQVQNMTMTREYYESLGLTYKADYLYTNDDLSKTDSINGVEYIQGNESLKENLDDMMSMVTDLIVLIVFLAVILGAVIIYNMGVLSYGEKEYQFATLKVLGFDNKKIKRVFIKQNIWISIVSAILGMPCGYFITDYVFTMVADRDYDFGATITFKTYIISFVVTVLCSYLVSLFLARKIKKIDMVTSLKGNE
jgi:ABC-type antimicrobial peptide transport system permease subunit